MPNLTLKFEDKVFLEETTCAYSMIAGDPVSSKYFHKKQCMLKVTPSAVHF